MVARVSGSVIVFKLVQELNACVPIVVTPLGSTTLVKAWQPQKALKFSSFTLPGMLTLVAKRQPRKACTPILEIPSLMTIDSILSQLSVNGESPFS